MAGCVFGIAGTHGLELSPIDSLSAFAAIQSTEFSDEQQAAVDAMVPEGDYRTYGHRPFNDGAYIERSGAFFQVAVQVTGSKTMPRMVLGAEDVADADDPVSLDEYPEHDRERIVTSCRLALTRERETGRNGEPENDFVYVFRTTTEDETMLLPTPEHKVVECLPDRVMELWVEERELDEEEYTTSVTRIADSSVEFEQLVESEYVIEIAELELTEDQLDIIDTAVEDGVYAERGRMSDTFGELIRMLHDRQPRSNSLLKYEGEYYEWTDWHSD